MSFRDRVNENASAVTVAAVVLLIVALGAAYWQMRAGGPPPRATEAYYLDLDEGTVFVAGADDAPPIATPAGGERGVRAVILSCGECPADLAGTAHDELRGRDAFIGWLERYTDEAHGIILEHRQDARDDPEATRALRDAQERGLRIADPRERRWVEPDGDAGVRIMLAAEQRCDDHESARQCDP